MNAALNELDRLWQASSASAVVSIPEATSLWHCGRIPSMEHLDGDRALWTTRNADRSDDYLGFARGPASWTKLGPAKLHFAAARELKAADFALQSLLEFTMKHCSSQHDVMKINVRAWMIRNDFDAIVRLNRDADEVVVARPVKDLRLVSALPL